MDCYSPWVGPFVRYARYRAPLAIRPQLPLRCSSLALPFRPNLASSTSPTLETRPVVECEANDL
jgi:hypothetical protein